VDLQSWLASESARLVTGLMVFARFGGLLATAPLISGRNVPVQLRIGLAGALTLMLVPILPAPAPMDLPVIAAGIAKEVLVGVVLGWTASLFLSGVQMAGEWLDLQGGFQAGAVLNPLFDSQSAPLGTLKHLLAGLVFFGSGGCATVLRAAVWSFRASPPGTLQWKSGAADDWITVSMEAFWLAVRLAGPVAAALFLAEVLIGLASRVMPQLNALVLSLPVKAMLAVVAIASTMPATARLLEGAFARMGDLLAHALRALGG
jgi:flagellar biosynthetic protein FliR